MAAGTPVGMSELPVEVRHSSSLRVTTIDRHDDFARVFAMLLSDRHLSSPSDRVRPLADAPDTAALARRRGPQRPRHPARVRRRESSCSSPSRSSAADGAPQLVPAPGTELELPGDHDMSGPDLAPLLLRIALGVVLLMHGRNQRLALVADLPARRAGSRASRLRPQPKLHAAISAYLEGRCRPRVSSACSSPFACRAVIGTMTVALHHGRTARTASSSSTRG